MSKYVTKVKQEVFSHEFQIEIPSQKTNYYQQMLVLNTYTSSKVIGLVTVSILQTTVLVDRVTNSR